LTFVAWGAVAGRSAELAADLEGRSLCLFPPGRRRPPVLVRWILSAAATAAHVWRRRPEVVVVTNPPLVAGLVAWAVGRSVGARVALDSHPGGFGAQGDRVATRLQPLHRWLARRVDVSIVAAPVWQDRILSWGGQAMVVHEAPGDWQFTAVARHRRLRVLYVGRFAPDEPWEAVLEAARATPEYDVHLTGDPRHCGADRRQVPDNVRFLGYLDPVRYRHAVVEADVVVCLTTEPGSVMRAACEAVWVGRPIVVSDWPISRELFPFAVHVANGGEELAIGLRRVDVDFGELAASGLAAYRLQRERWELQRRELRARLQLDVGSGPAPYAG
jgi:glycosyltransferase involved in cell wall biosynthesis